MKIGLSGAQGTGKTTLMRAILDSGYLPAHYSMCTEVARSLAAQGYNINESGNDVTQLLVAYKIVECLNSSCNFIADRTMLDCYVYTAYLHSVGKVSNDTLAAIEYITRCELPKYDRIFLFKPEFDLVDDGTRSTDAAFQQTINDIFVRSVQHFQISPIIVTGSVEERVIQFKEQTYGECQ